MRLGRSNERKLSYFQYRRFKIRITLVLLKQQNRYAKKAVFEYQRFKIRMSSDIKDQRFVHSVEAKEQTCKFLGIKCCTGISRVCSPRISKIQKMHVDISLESQRFKRFVGIKSRPASNLKDSLESTRTSCQIINGDIQKPRYLYLYTVKSESILDGSPLAIRRKGGGLKISSVQFFAMNNKQHRFALVRYSPARRKTPRTVGCMTELRHCSKARR